MFEDETKGPADQADTVEQDGLEAEADSAGQVSDITTESSETQAEAAPDDSAKSSSPDASAETAMNLGSPRQTAAQKGLLKYQMPDFTSPQEALEDHQAQVNKSLIVNEDLMMTYLFHEGISESYYKLWRDDANLYFRNLCIFRMRLARRRHVKTGGQEAPGSVQKESAETPEKPSDPNAGSGPAA